jgi:hypothetical protein
MRRGARRTGARRDAIRLAAAAVPPGVTVIGRPSMLHKRTFPIVESVATGNDGRDFVRVRRQR